jgi:hypothetical protein
MSTPPVEAASTPSVGRYEIPLAALASAAAFSALFLAPVGGGLGLPLAAVPLVRLAHRRDVLTGILGCALGAALIAGLGWATGGPLTGLAMALLSAVITVLPTATVGFLRAGIEPSRAYLGLCLAGCAFLTACAVASSRGPGPTLASEVASGFDGLIPVLVDAYSSKTTDAEEVVRWRSFLEGSREFVRRYLWGIFGAFYVFGAAIAFFGGAAAARPVPTAEAARLEALRVPAQAAGLFVGAGAAFALLPGAGKTIAGNVLLPLAALFFLAGLSIICHFFRRWLRIRLLRAGLYVLVAVYFPLNACAALLGLFDWYVDFRRRGGEGTERA